MKPWTVRDLIRELAEYDMNTKVFILDENKEDWFNIAEISDESKMHKPNEVNVIFLTF